MEEDWKDDINSGATYIFGFCKKRDKLHNLTLVEWKDGMLVTAEAEFLNVIATKVLGGGDKYSFSSRFP
jgi:hypothetical protein